MYNRTSLTKISYSKCNTPHVDNFEYTKYDTWYLKITWNIRYKAFKAAKFKIFNLQETYI